MWAHDELMNLAEAARLMWPDGPLTERSLRTAIREGRLPISVVAGKFFVTKQALGALSACRPWAPSAETSVGPASETMRKDLAIIRKMRCKH
jgi:hypothetical protein